MRVRAKQYMYYDKKGYQAGDEYEMDDREESTAKLLSVLGKVEIVGKPKAATAPTYQTRAVEAEGPKPEPPMTTDSSPLVGSERRQYRRRDMKAEK